MLDASKYAQHFPDECQQSETPDVTSAPRLPGSGSALLAALCRLEREFREILRAEKSKYSERLE
jgi:hypothetical protein